MTHDQHEIEDKYAVDADTQVPALEQVPGVADVLAQEVHQLEATYFDTPALTLATAGISLRRRTGGADAGNRTLQPVAVLRTRRHIRRLVDIQGTVLAEFCDDHVSADVPGEPGPVTWREWEVELVRGDTAFLATVAALVEKADGEPSRTRKLTRALGERVPAPSGQQLPTPTREGPASRVVQKRLLEQIAVIRRYDPLVRREAPDAVHQMRVGVRRLRNAFATYRPFLLREQTEPVRDELKWLAAALGEPRDAEVMRHRLEKMLAEEPPEVVRGVGYQRMDEEMRAQYARARQRLLETLETDRYFALLDRLDELAIDPPWSEKAAKPLDFVLRQRVRHDYKRLVGRIDFANQAEDPGEREHRLHEGRKAVKRVRYAAETLTAIYGKDAKRIVKAMKRVQSRLGEHHDAFATQQRLRELSDEAAGTGDHAFVFGALHAREQRALIETDAQFVHEWSKASRKNLRRWLAP